MIVETVDTTINSTIQKTFMRLEVFYLKKAGLTTREVAQELGVTQQVVLSYCEKGHIKPCLIEIGGRHLFDPDEVKALKASLGYEHNLDDYVSAPQAAKMLGIGITTVYSYERQGVLKVARRLPSGRKFFLKSDIEELNKQMGGNPDNTLISSNDLALKSGVPVSVIYRMCNKGLLKPTRVMLSGKYLFKPSDISTVRCAIMEKQI